jgi:hypothetical protein
MINSSTIGQQAKCPVRFVPGDLLETKSHVYSAC